jgi:ATP-binding protein involved in chromosome partitioning
MAGDPPTEEEIRDRLEAVEDPELEDDIVTLGLINDITIDEEAETIDIDLVLGAPYSPTETAMASEAREALSDLGYEIELSASVGRGMESAEQVLPNVQNVIAVASGKGGVGKSTVAVNLAAGLSELGARVGLFDADVYGPNIPRMVKADEAPRATAEDSIIPPEKFGMKLMSMDFLAGEDDPIIWRGPMVDNVLTQLWEDVEWGELDYMVVDLPPGTGDAQLTLLQTIPVTGAVIVTTPQGVALDDARKGLMMFSKHDTPVLGIVENMSTFKCPDCGSEHPIFGEGGGKQLAEDVDMPFLGQIPIDPEIRQSGDEGRPMVMQDGETADSMREFANKTANMQGIVHRQDASNL